MRSRAVRIVRGVPAHTGAGADECRRRARSGPAAIEGPIDHELFSRLRAGALPRATNDPSRALHMGFDTSDAGQPGYSTTLIAMLGYRFL